MISLIKELVEKSRALDKKISKVKRMVKYTKDAVNVWRKTIVPKNTPSDDSIEDVAFHVYMRYSSRFSFEEILDVCTEIDDGEEIDFNDLDNYMEEVF